MPSPPLPSLSQPARDRIPALDVVRGAALLGVLVVNVTTQFRVSSFDRFVADAGVATPSPTPLDRWVERVIAVGLETEPLILFSFLFGLGLAAIRDRSRNGAEASQWRAAVVIARRVVFLLLLGTLHFIFLWSGDVLTLYASVALVAVVLLALPTRALLVVALALFVVQALPLLPYPRPFASHEEMRQHVELVRQVYGFGSYRDVLAVRFLEMRPAFALLLWGAPRTLGLFLLGAWAWRVGAFSTPLPIMRRFAWIALAAGAAITVAENATSASATLRAALATGGDLALALGYGAGLFVAASHPRGFAALRWLVPIGRMTLTSYLVQSVVLGLVFYGYGLGLFGRVGVAASAAIALALFAGQAVLAAWWLRSFRLGPVEWAWRSFTDGTRLPIRG